MAALSSVLSYEGLSSLSHHTLIRAFLRGATNLRPAPVHRYPTWDLNKVLLSLTKEPFESLRVTGLQFLTYKVVFLVAITSARRISEIAALSVRQDLCVFHADRVVLRPDPTFLPKVNSAFHRAQELILPNFCPNPSQEREQQWHKLDVAGNVSGTISEAQQNLVCTYEQPQRLCNIHLTLLAEMELPGEDPPQRTSFRSPEALPVPLLAEMELLRGDCNGLGEAEWSVEGLDPAFGGSILACNGSIKEANRGKIALPISARYSLLLWPSDGSRHFAVKLAKLDATVLNDYSLAAVVPYPETTNHAVLACSTGIHEEHYVSEGVENNVSDCREYRDAGTITDVCNSTDLPEVEIISLLEEQLPHYKLRADTIYGYDHDDWLHTPLISPDANIDLTTEQIEETLKYFLLCAERVGQMTKTYNDIDAVTRLLEEKERDLELAARIGQSLLKKNKILTERNELLEEQVEHIREEVSQLRHELSMKDELLQFYTSAAEESDPDSICSTPLKRNESSSTVQNYFHFDSLQKKLKDLEEENVVLRSEACHLKTETITYEEKEQQLVNDCVKELRDANLQIATISEELAKKTEDAARQQEEITHLLSQIVDLQKKAKACTVENEELVQHLGAAKDAQRQLTAELRELEDKYAECMEMLHEAQEELKNLRNKTMPNAISRRYHSLGLFPMDSLAAEIEGSMRKELHLDDTDCSDSKYDQYILILCQKVVFNINNQ
ncbi:trafficking kinesin-binding protein 1-like [Notechis scutatus]|uniref:Trafficking kinesin-binding protein 1-like n=1 Tax=Notechis scutatus TaxID=8663 RepID=A0A6J1UTJ0_9SAUR|nr:trafficking kinesin-binding protein 1-like [Notechis scutatus]